jgi:hypothetical protein
MMCKQDWDMARTSTRAPALAEVRPGVQPPRLDWASATAPWEWAMAEISIGNAVGAGFHLIRRQPLVVATWGLAGLLVTGVTWSTFGPIYASLFGEMLRNGGAGANPMTSPLFVEQMRQVQGLSLLVGLFSLFVDCVVYCAVFRAVIHPEQNRFAYIRIGAPEVFALVLAIAGYIAFLIALIIPALVIAAVVAAFVAAHAAVAGVVIGVAGALALAFALVYVLLRLSLVVPMMVADGKFHFADAWALTKSHACALLLVGIVLFVILMAAEIVLGLVMLAVGAGYLSSAAGGLSHLQEYFQRPPGEILGSAAPLLIIVAVLWIPLTGCVFAIIGAPWARAYRDLSGPDLAATFS